jgi:Mg2+-importing ATPase
MTHAVEMTEDHPAPTEVPFWSFSSADIEKYLADAAGSRTGPVRIRHHLSPRAVARLRIIGRQFSSPITLILVIAAGLSMVVSDVTDGSIILSIVALSAILGAWQESRSADAVAAITAQVAIDVCVQRDGVPVAVALSGVVPGDHLILSAGDIIPGDCLLLKSDYLSIDESALTGESFPVSKVAGTVLAVQTPLAARTNSLFAGTHVVSGTGLALVVLTGAQTTFGHVAASLRQKPKATSFEIGIRKFGILLLRVTIVLVSATLAINLALQRPLLDSFLFAIALAVGITPQMLPVVVSVSLAVGARKMARVKVIVKRLDVIEDLGAMSVLCTDKTGTITVGVVTIKNAIDVQGEDDPRVLDLAVLNAGLHTGYSNPLDLAVLAGRAVPAGAAAIGEVPYDFIRKRLSVAVEVDGAPTLVTKGAFDSVLSCSTRVRIQGGVHDITARIPAITALAQSLGTDGLRVIAVAYRILTSDEPAIGPLAEHDLVFAGLLVFEDPIKDSVKDSITSLMDLGVEVKVVSGDNRFVTASLAAKLGFANARVVVGSELDQASHETLLDLVSKNSLFAEVEPGHKIKILTALKDAGETVGFLGDGINDAGALHMADVGISVDSGVNVAKEAAAVVLLEKDLSVVATGIRLGRRTFTNTLKYVRVVVSANFGFILSTTVAAATLPFLPMLASQILVLNLIADVPNTLISRDRVDAERLRGASVWSMRTVTRVMIFFGITSSVFDLITFAVLMWVFHTDAVLFHSGWFVLSALTQFVAMMTLRTSRPFWRSRPEPVYLLVSGGITAVGILLPISPFATALGFVALPLPLVLALFIIAAIYGLANEAMKRIIKF